MTDVNIFSCIEKNSATCSMITKISLLTTENTFFYENFWQHL